MRSTTPVRICRMRWRCSIAKATASCSPASIREPTRGRSGSGREIRAGRRRLGRRVTSHRARTEQFHVVIAYVKDAISSRSSRSGAKPSTVSSSLASARRRDCRRLARPDRSLTFAGVQVASASERAASLAQQTGTSRARSNASISKRPRCSVTASRAAAESGNSAVDRRAGVAAREEGLVRRAWRGPGGDGSRAPRARSRIAADRRRVQPHALARAARPQHPALGDLARAQMLAAIPSIDRSRAHKSRDVFAGAPRPTWSSIRA